jgi:hypothetical protein
VVKELSEGRNGATGIGSFFPRSRVWAIALFERNAPNYDWINRIVAIGVGERLADGPLYNVIEVL